MKRFFILLALMSVAASAAAQVAGSSVYVGIAMPRKDLTAGPVIGYKYQYDLNVVDGLGLIGTVDFTLNRSDKDARKSNEAAFENWLKNNNYDDAKSEVTHRTPVNFAIPVNVGANYSYPFGRIRAWAEAGIGFALLFSSRSVWKAEKFESVSYESTLPGRPHTVTNSGSKHHYDVYKYSPAAAFSYRFAFGAMLDDRFSFGLNVDGVSGYTQKSVRAEDVKPYWNSNSGSYKRETKYKGKAEGYAYVSLRLGYHF